VIVWRWLVALVLGIVIGLPLAMPLAALVNAQAWTWSADDQARILQLAANTLLLSCGTLLLAVPPGAFLAILLFRGRPWGRRVALGLLLLLLFIPLPVLVSSWQSLLGQGGLLPMSLWRNTLDRPWATGWYPALIVHAVAALPWLVFLVGLGLCGVEPAAEEEGLLQVPATSVLWRVSLPRALPSLFAAVVLVTLFTAADSSVTGLLAIPTLAEEVDSQFTRGDDAGLVRTLVLSLPIVLVAWLVLLAALPRLERALPALPVILQRPPLLPMSSRWTAALALAAVFMVTLVPLPGLIWKLGQAGRPPSWALSNLSAPLRNEAFLYGGQLVQTVVVAMITGAAVACLALVCCWLARDSGWLSLLLLVSMTFAAIVPGPVVGIGLKQLILVMVQTLPDGPWTDLLYRGPSPLPIMWAQTIRFLPVAMFFLWPVVRLVPREQCDAARLEGAGPLAELMHIVWPITRRATLITAVAVTALCLGEVGASGRVETPNSEPFAKLILDRMHYGIDSNVAALCVLLLAGIVALMALLFAVRMWQAR
jgi:iron(III) transport system permease protein